MNVSSINAMNLLSVQEQLPACIDSCANAGVGALLGALADTTVYSVSYHGLQETLVARDSTCRFESS